MLLDILPDFLYSLQQLVLSVSDDKSYDKTSCGACGDWFASK